MKVKCSKRIQVLYSVKGEIVKTEQMNYLHCSIKLIMILALSLVVSSHIGQDKSCPMIFLIVLISIILNCTYC